MIFLEEALKAKGLYVVSLGNTLFTEVEGKGSDYVLYTFPFKYHADYYRQAIDTNPNNHFIVSFWSFKKLWSHYVAGTIRTMYICSCDINGQAAIQDLLFADSNAIVH